MRKDLLLVLANFLESDESLNSNTGKFDLSEWMSSYSYLASSTRGPEEHREKLKQRIDPASTIKPFKAIRHDRSASGGLYLFTPIECKTAGCAIGWAATLPEFQAAGLRLAAYTNDPNRVYPVLVDPKTEKPLTALSQGASGDSTKNAICRLLDINLDDMTYMFFPSKYSIEDRVNPKVVAKRIREVIKGRVSL